MESGIHHHSVLVCPQFFFIKKKWLQYSFGKKTVLLSHTGCVCEDEVTNHCLSQNQAVQNFFWKMCHTELDTVCEI